MPLLVQINKLDHSILCSNSQNVHCYFYERNSQAGSASNKRAKLMRANMICQHFRFAGGGDGSQRKLLWLGNFQIFIPELVVNR